MWYIIALSHMTGLMPIPSKGEPMTLRPIRNEEDYETALEEIAALWAAAAGTPKADRLDILVLLVEAYEVEH